MMTSRASPIRRGWRTAAVVLLVGVIAFLSGITSWPDQIKKMRPASKSEEFSQANLVDFFAQMGYDPDTLHLEGITPPVVSVKDIYRQLPDQPDIVARMERAIGPSDKPSNLATADIEDTAYLADIAGLVTKDSRWCFSDSFGDEVTTIGNAAHLQRLVRMGSTKDK
jgi:hypothetical protein